MGTVSRVHTFASGAILTAAQLNNEFDNLLTSSAINGGLDATNLGVTAGQATASKALVVDASRNLADATGSNRINNLALSGTFESTGAVTASAGITSGGNIVSDTDSTDDLGTTGVRWANLFVDDVTVTNNVTIGGTLTLTGGITLNGNTTIGDSSADTLTVNSTITSNLIFTDATYDIGASGATRPRDLHLSRNALMGGTLGVTGLITATGGVSGALTGNVTGDLSGNVTGGTISGTTGTYSGNVTISKDAPQLIMTDSGSGGGTSDIIIDAIGSNHGFYFRADGATNHVILESNGDLKVDTDTLYIDASADRVGINTASPQVDFHVNNASTNGVARISTSHATSYAQVQLVNQSGNYWYQTIVYGDNSYRLFNGSDRLIVDTSGIMGLGVTPTSGWSGRTALEIEGASTGYVTSPNGPIAIGSNIYYNGGDKFVGNGYAPLYALSSGNHIWYTSNNNTSGAGAAVTLTQAMTLTNAGLLGLGTGSPTTKLHVSGASSASALRLDETTSSANSYLGYIDTSGNFGIDVNGGGYLRFAVGGAERARITSDGKLCINRTSGSTALSIDPHATGQPNIQLYNKTNDAYTYLKNDGSAFVIQNSYGTTAGFKPIQFMANGSVNLHIDEVGGSVGIGTVSPQGPLTVKPATNENLNIVGGSGDLRLSALNDAQSATVQLSIQADPLYIRGTGGVIKSAFLGNGNVGIGTSSPEAPLEVIADSSQGYAVFLEAAASGTEGAALRGKGTYSIADAGTQTFTVGNGAIVMISENNTGDGAMFFCGFKSATVTLVADPNSRYANTVTAGKISLTKSASSSTVTLTNNSGSTKSFTILKIICSD